VRKHFDKFLDTIGLPDWADKIRSENYTKARRERFLAETSAFLLELSTRSLAQTEVKVQQMGSSSDGTIVAAQNSTMNKEEQFHKKGIYDLEGVLRHVSIVIGVDILAFANQFSKNPEILNDESNEYIHMPIYQLNQTDRKYKLLELEKHLRHPDSSESIKFAHKEETSLKVFRDYSDMGGRTPGLTFEVINKNNRFFLSYYTDTGEIHVELSCLLGDTYTIRESSADSLVGKITSAYDWIRKIHYQADNDEEKED
jgi:hypothetical protein